VNRGRLAAAATAFAIIGSQAGHLLAYQLRFGAASQRVLSSGAHEYFPLLVRTVLGAAAMAALVVLLIVGFARLAAGGRLEKGSAPSLLRVLSVLYTLQVAIFLAQETIEGGSAGELVLWGLAGQLPVALGGALALRWLAARLEPALSRLSLRPVPTIQIAPISIQTVYAATAPAIPSSGYVIRAFSRRGPPS
jgi:hypothetical protein